MLSIVSVRISRRDGACNRALSTWALCYLVPACAMPPRPTAWRRRTDRHTVAATFAIVCPPVNDDRRSERASGSNRDNEAATSPYTYVRSPDRHDYITATPAELKVQYTEVPIAIRTQPYTAVTYNPYTLQIGLVWTASSLCILYIVHVDVSALSSSISP